MVRAVSAPNLPAEPLGLSRQKGSLESSANTPDFFEESAKKVFDRAGAPPYKPPPRGHGGLLLRGQRSPSGREYLGACPDVLFVA
jgi:hypothetical protein